MRKIPKAFASLDDVREYVEQRLRSLDDDLVRAEIKQKAAATDRDWNFWEHVRRSLLAQFHELEQMSARLL